MTITRRALPLLALLLALWPAASARAAFPGRNGLLVVQPVRGGGLVLSTPWGTGTHRICTDVALCGRPAAPRFAPDGGDITFATGTVPAIVATAGTCMWCRLGTPLTAARGATPAFTADGRAVTYSGSGGLARTNLSGTSSTLAAVAENEAVWSARGARAFVRGGLVLFVPAGGTVARRLAAGSEPDFAPDGLSLAYAQTGWIWTVRIGGGAARRDVRGSHPVISPDGRQLAFVAPNGHIAIAGIDGRHARAVQGLTGRAVDWQPVPRARPAACSRPAGARYLAGSAEASVTEAGPAATPIGCLKATGRRTRFDVATPAKATGAPIPTATVLAGRYALFATITDPGRATCGESLTRFDLASGRSATLYSRACGAHGGTVDGLGLDSSGFAAWHASEQTAVGQPLLDITCPSAGLCVAVDGHGNAATSTDPTAAASGWSVAKVAPALTRVGCHGTTLCAGLAGGTVAVTNDPADGPGKWSAPVSVDTAVLDDVACPADNLCVAVDATGGVVTSTNPAGGASAWQRSDVAGGDALEGIACPSATLCVAVGQNGDVLTSTDPTGGAAAWSRSTAEAGGATLEGVACPLTTLCVATDSAGRLLSTSSPAAGAAWSVAATPGTPAPLEPPACASAALCLATNTAGEVFTVRAPGTPAQTVGVEQISSSLEAVACIPGTTTCAATDAFGAVLSTTDAASGGEAWTASGVDQPPCGACVAEQLYATDDDGRRALDTRLPGPGGLISAAALAGDARTVTWRDAGAPRSFALR